MNGVATSGLATRAGALSSKKSTKSVCLAATKKAIKPPWKVRQIKNMASWANFVIDQQKKGQKKIIFYSNTKVHMSHRPRNCPGS